MLWTVIISSGCVVLYELLPRTERSTPAVAYCCKPDDKQNPSASPPDRDTEQSTPQNALPAPSPASTDSSQSPPPENQPPTYPMGQQFSVGYWSYLCHGAYWTPALGVDPYSIDRASAEFVVVDITARNDDTSSSTLPPFQLMDREGRTYDESSGGMLNQGFFSVLEELNPGVLKRGKIAFDVPPDRQYSLLLSGGIESGKRATVILPASVPPSVDQSVGATSQPDDKTAPDDLASIRKAAEQDDTNAQSKLGMMYLNGQGLPKDYVEAYFWLDIAASEPERTERIKALITGTSELDIQRLRHLNLWIAVNKPFFSRVDKLRDDAVSHLTPTELTQTQERVRKWIEEHPIQVPGLTGTAERP
jgi:hypothetical protein